MGPVARDPHPEHRSGPQAKTKEAADPRHPPGFRAHPGKPGAAALRASTGDMAPAQGGFTADELERPPAIVHELPPPSQPGDRSMMARALDFVRGRPGAASTLDPSPGPQPFGQQQHSPGYAGGKEPPSPDMSTTNEECPYPMVRSRVDDVMHGSGQAPHVTTPPVDLFPQQSGAGKRGW